MVDVARMISEGKVTDNYQFFIVLVVLAVLTGLVVWFVAPYLGERGKLLALAEKLQERLDEIRQTTEAAESVRTRIAHSDWTVKEHKTLMRTKLENLMTAAYRTKTASELDADFQNDDINLKISSKEPVTEVQLIYKMYFAVMKDEVQDFITAHSQFSIWLITERSKQRQQKLVIEREEFLLNQIREAPDRTLNGITYAAKYGEYKAARERMISIKDSYVDQYGPHSIALSDALQKLEARAACLMEDYITPTLA